MSRQTFDNFEVIVVDGKSEDKTVKKAKGFKKDFKKFKLISSQKRSASHQRNLGSKKAESEWLIFMDTDNRIPKYFLQGIRYKTEELSPDLLSTWIDPDSSKGKDIATATLANLYIEMQKKITKTIDYGVFFINKQKVFRQT